MHTEFISRKFAIVQGTVWQRFAPLLITGFLATGSAHGQWIGQSFRHASEADWTLLNSAQWTANGSPAIDIPGQGWLRLTDAAPGKQGQALYSHAFAPADGLIVDFDYVMWGPGSPPNAGDGITFFLFDKANNAAMTGQSDQGSSLGYCQGPGGILGLGFDAFGLYGLPVGCPSGGANQMPQSFVLRGPNSSNSPVIASTVSLPAPETLNSVNAMSRPSQTRSARVTLLPLSTGGYQVMLDEGATGTTPSSRINSVFPASYLPASLGLGFGAATGGATQVHEVRLNQAIKPADVRIETSGYGNNFLLGEMVAYHLTLTNKVLSTAVANAAMATISDPATAPALNDSLSAQLSGASWTCQATGAGSTCPAASGAGAISNLGNYTLGQQGSLLFTVTGTLPANSTALCGVQSNMATASFAATGGYTDIDSTDNQASASFVVDCTTALSGTSTANTAQTVLGQTGSYAFTVRNAGPATETVTIEHTPPAGLSNPTWTCHASGGAACPVPNGSSGVQMAGLILPAGSDIGFELQGTASQLGTLNSLIRVMGASSGAYQFASADITVTAASAVAVPASHPLGLAYLGLFVAALGAWHRKRELAD